MSRRTSSRGKYQRVGRPVSNSASVRSESATTCPFTPPADYPGLRASRPRAPRIAFSPDLGHAPR